MRIDQLEALVVISRCQSLSAASEQLHITVQALSASIKSLEHELGMTLLERNSKGVIMTRDGMTVVDVAKRFLSEMYKIQFKHEDPRITVLDQPLTIYVQNKLYELFVPKMLCEMRRRIPDTSLTVQKYTQQQPLVEAILGGKTEFAFIFYNTMQQGGYRYQEGLTFIPLFECKIVCLAHHDFPLSSLKTCSLKKLLEYPIVIYMTPEWQQNDMLRLITSFGQPKSVQFEEDYYMYREMIATGEGLGFSILTPFESYNRPWPEQVERIILNDDIHLYGGYIIKKDAPLSEASDVFLRYTKNYMLRVGKAYPSYVF